MHSSFFQSPDKPKLGLFIFTSALVLTFRGVWVLAAGLAIAEAANCTDTQTTDAVALVTEYRDEVSANCDADLCSSDCVATMTELAGLLPDCYEQNYDNYYERITANIKACTDSSSGSTFDSDPTSIDIFNACSSSQSATVNEVLTSYEAQSSAACEDDYCSSDCQSVLSAIADAIPSCVETTDDVNYYETILDMTDACGSTSGSTSTDDGDSDSDSTSDSSSTEASLPTAGSSILATTADNEAGVASLSVAVAATTIAGAYLSL